LGVFPAIAICIVERHRVALHTAVVGLELVMAKAMGGVESPPARISIMVPNLHEVQYY
jgi:hypothetical protein